MQKNHCLISNTEHLVAKIRSVKFSFLLSTCCNYKVISEPVDIKVNPFPNDKFKALSKLKAFADDNFNGANDS